MELHCLIKLQSESKCKQINHYKMIMITMKCEETFCHVKVWELNSVFRGKKALWHNRNCLQIKIIIAKGREEGHVTLELE